MIPFHALATLQISIPIIRFSANSVQCCCCVHTLLRIYMCSMMIIVCYLCFLPSPSKEKFNLHSRPERFVYRICKTMYFLFTFLPRGVDSGLPPRPHRIKDHAYNTGNVFYKIASVSVFFLELTIENFNDGM